MSSSASEYLDLYRAEGAALRRRRGDLGERDHASVTTTFSLAFAKIQAVSPAAADLLRLCAFLAPDAIPELILVEGAPCLGETLRSAIASKLSLLETVKEPCKNFPRPEMPRPSHFRSTASCKPSSATGWTTQPRSCGRNERCGR